MDARERGRSSIDGREAANADIEEGDIAYESALRDCEPLDCDVLDRTGEGGAGSVGVGGRVPSGVGGSEGSEMILATTTGVTGGSSGRGGEGDVAGAVGGASIERIVDSRCCIGVSGNSIGAGEPDLGISSTL